MRGGGRRPGKRHRIWLVLLGLCTMPLVAQQPAAAPVEPPVAVPAESTTPALAQQSAQLHALALALKQEMARTTRNMLSVSVVRKAEAIEKLAHAMAAAKSAPKSAQGKAKQ